MARFIVVVLDGFGVGEMPDVRLDRIQDIGSNTAYKLLEKFHHTPLPTLGRLGLNNIVRSPASIIEQNPKANTGTIMLRHEGADTFAGHQEIMGTLPTSPLVKPFQQSIDAIEQALSVAFDVARLERDGKAMLLVNGCVTVGDNLEAAQGQVYNVAANLNAISFDEVLKIGEIVRSNNDVARNIVFGGKLNSSQQLIDAIESYDDVIGTNAPKSGVYDDGFQVAHLGYGVDASVQAPSLLAQIGVKTVLVGKVADIVHNDQGTSYKKLVDTREIMAIANDEIANQETGFFCINVQETDLSGHQENAERYWRTLEFADKGIQKIIEQMACDDVLVVTADHGNDPFIGHGQHTRERVPLMVHRKGVSGCDLGPRETLADIGATACKFFGAKAPQSGFSFLKSFK